MREQGDGRSGSDGRAQDAEELAALLALPPAEIAAIPSRLTGLLLAHLRLAREDSLTGVANRRGIDERLAYEWERARRHQRPLSILLLDVDNLKDVNDEQGHAAGDEVLRSVAREVKAIVRSIDFVGRSGGDEFVVICTESDQDAATVVARKIESQLSAPVSLGVATLKPQQTVKELLITADAALYRAKTKHHSGVSAAPIVKVLRQPDSPADNSSPSRLETTRTPRRQGPEAAHSANRRLLFSPTLAAMLAGVDEKRLLAWRAAGLIGGPNGRGPAGKRIFSLSDLHAIDALNTLLKAEVDESGSHLRTALRAKSDFMRMVAHELRAPMTVIRGYVSLLGSGGLASLRAAGVEPLAVMETKLAEMNKLADQMLEVARLEDGRMLLQERRVDLRVVLREAVRTAGSAGRPERDLRVVVPDEEVPVMGDEPRLVTIVSNLVSNAIKYSPAESPIECIAAVDGPVARVRVTDRGAGIDDADYARLFQPFQRLKASPGVAGTGLGLYISRELARRHGGDLVAVAAEPRGTTFVLELPVAAPA